MRVTSSERVGEHRWGWYLCLDEPAAGLDTSESEELGVTLRRLADGGQSMLLIAEGPPEVVHWDSRVIAAYLGQDTTTSEATETAETT
jgi:branched-chain amino acid transport system ATP-binding protein